MGLKPVILAGGVSEKLSMLVPSGRSKHCLRILGKPVIYYPLNAVERVIEQDIIVVYTFKDVLKDALKYSRRRVIGVEQRGSGIEGAILSAERELSDTDYFLLVFGDLIFDPNALSSLLGVFYKLEPTATVLTIPLNERFISTYGVAVVDIDGSVKKVVEKPSSIEEVEKPAYTLGGIYILPTWILDYLKIGETLPEVINRLAKEHRVVSVHWSGLWIDIGYPADLLEASRQLLDRMKGTHIGDDVEIAETAIVKPPAYIENGVIIDHYSVVKGPVYIGRDSFIGAHSFIRHYTSLESNNRIGAYTEVKNSILQPYVFIDSHCFIGDSIVGENTIVGPHTVTLNVLPRGEAPPRLREHIISIPTIKKPVLKLGAIIGYNVRIGSDTILYPQSIVPPETDIEPGTIYRTKTRI